LKVLLTIFVNPIFAAYRIVREALAKNWNLMVWDIVFTVVWPVNWVMDLITICSTGEPFNYAAWFGATVRRPRAARRRKTRNRRKRNPLRNRLKKNRPKTRKTIRRSKSI
jgi:hypothetical protein